MKHLISFIMAGIFILNNFTFSYGYDKYANYDLSTQTDATGDENIDLGITSKSAVLIEANSGKILYEKNKDETLKPASVTKIMTLLLCFDNISAGNLSYDDIITISSHAASMGGSQCFFEEGEQQTVQDIIKCIEISSGNDAAVAMGEHIAGSETEFVKMMNAKAKELGMINTNFENACGLDSPNHYTSAMDISIMSRELITKHPEIFDVSTIWMDHIIHKTSKGESRFDLANTNKFLKQYTGANGLKTGFTSEAGYCISGTATRNDITLIAVIMGAPTKDIRNSELAKLLDYGFSKCDIYIDNSVLENIDKILIDNGIKDFVIPEPIVEHQITLVNDNPNNIEKKIVYDNIKAPIKKGDKIGSIQYYLNNSMIDEINIISSENIQKKSYSLSIRDLCNRLFVVE